MFLYISICRVMFIFLFGAVLFVDVLLPGVGGERLPDEG